MSGHEYIGSVPEPTVYDLDDDVITDADREAVAYWQNRFPSLDMSDEVNPGDYRNNWESIYDASGSFADYTIDAATPDIEVPLWMKATAGVGVVMVLLLILRPFVEAGTTYAEVLS